MADIQREVDSESRNFGVQIIDVRIRRADLPEEATQATYARMRSERARTERMRAWLQASTRPTCRPGFGAERPTCSSMPQVRRFA